MAGLRYHLGDFKQTRKHERKEPNMRLCTECNQPIHALRLQALPHTRTCLEHSNEEPLTDADVELDGADQEEQSKIVQGK